MSVISQKIGMPSPFHLRGKNSSFLSISLQLMPPDIASINSVFIVSSSCFGCSLLEKFLLKYAGIRLNPVIKYKYATCITSVILCSIGRFFPSCS